MQKRVIFWLRQRTYLTCFDSEWVSEREREREREKSAFQIQMYAIKRRPVKQSVNEKGEGRVQIYWPGLSEQCIHWRESWVSITSIINIVWKWDLSLTNQKRTDWKEQPVNMSIEKCSQSIDVWYKREGMVILKSKN